MASHKRIFEGVRIVDVTQYLAGPVATRLFVDLGAEVIKVELPPGGEGSRRLRFSASDGPKGAAPTYFAMHNRGKKCVCIDFKRPAGAAIVKDLAQERRRPHRKLYARGARALRTRLCAISPR